MLYTRKNWVKFVGIFLGAISLSSSSSAASDDDHQDAVAGQLVGLPHCDESTVPTDFSKRLLYVSTLDGRLTALDITNQGEIKWSVTTGDALLSSSIHKLDLTNNGKWVRMIPSLNGNLYKFDGDTIEAIPLKAEDLLRSSFKFSDDIVMSGGMETRSFGISVKTGNVLYECSLHGCQNFTHTTEPIGPKEQQYNPAVDDVLVLRRGTQTVRAIEPREGVERWNFSIGMHELELMKSKDCQGQMGPSEIDLMLADLEFKAVVPEGIVCAFSKTNPGQILWMHQFEFPIVSAWKSDTKDAIERVDFFEGAEWLWNGNLGLYAEKNSGIAPSIYLGMYQKQPYIQESEFLRQLTAARYDNKLFTDDWNNAKIPFKPYPATKEGLALIEDHSGEKQGDSPNALATSLLYASEYVNGNGFYFYTKDDLNKTQKAICDSLDNDGAPRFKLNFIGRSLQWLLNTKEIFVLFIATVGFFFFLWQFYGKHEVRTLEGKAIVVVEKPVPSAIEALEGVHFSKSSQHSSNDSNGDGPYQSRFVTDYDVLQVLGKGGFGVVFEAKNKLDDCRYAIKRIVLPSRQESRDRVMREVKTLAHCDHQNIVRYFSSWMETPPENWQEEHDRMLQARELLSTSIDIGTPTETTESKYDKIRKKTLDGILSTFGDSTVDGSHIVFEDDPKIQNGHSTVFEERADDSDSLIVFEDDEKSKDDEVRVPISSAVVSTSKSRRPTSLSLSSSTKDIIVSFPRRAYLYIQMQLCHKESLRDWLSQYTFEDRRSEIIPIFKQIVGAVEYVHLKGLIHRDLKPGNIFFSLNGLIKIGDFGLVTDMADEANASEMSPLLQPTCHTKRVGTHLYMSPEQIAGRNYNYKVDIYSLGLILFELYMTFRTEMERINTLKDLRLNPIRFPEEFPERFNDVYGLLERMLHQDPAGRPTTFGIRASPLIMDSVPNENWHYELPPRPRRESRNSFSISADNY